MGGVSQVVQYHQPGPIRSGLQPSQEPSGCLLRLTHLLVSQLSGCLGVSADDRFPGKCLDPRQQIHLFGSLVGVRGGELGLPDATHPRQNLRQHDRTAAEGGFLQRRRLGPDLVTVRQRRYRAHAHRPRHLDRRQ